MRLATPLIFASLGETIAQRAGVLNIGLEGFMIIGALTSLYVTVESGIAL
ncbi:MAG: ABC transporter permease, partial [Acidimicrobiia bacterium]|nr:ABC transporter permease [Acidimicrobiia bacterium]